MLALLGVTIVWGWGFVFSQLALDSGLGPAAVMAGRFGLAAVLLGAVFFRTIRREYKKGEWRAGLILGAILFAGFFSQISGLEFTTPSNNAFITGAYVVFVPFIGWILTKKRPKAILFIASLISLVGVAVLSVNFQDGLSVGPGDAITLFSALMFACQIAVTGLYASCVHFIVLVWMQMAVSAALSGILLLGGSALSTAMPGSTYLSGLVNVSGFATPGGIIAILFLGIFSTSLCYFLQTMAQRHVASSKAGVILGTEALFGALFSVLVGYEPFTLRMVAGGLIMFFSIILPELPALFQRKKTAPPP